MHTLSGKRLLLDECHFSHPRCGLGDSEELDMKHKDVALEKAQDDKED